MKSQWIRGLPMPKYINDRSTSSGSTLRMAWSEPERYGRWMSGKNVDQPTAAKAQGSLTHLFALGYGAGDFADFAFYPNRNEATYPEEVLKEGTKTVKIPTGRMLPQDPSDEGRYKRLNRSMKGGPEQHRKFMAENAGKIIVYPESQPIVQAMARAIRSDRHAGGLLGGPGYEPEVTGYWVCPETGEQHRIRLDALRESDDIEIELKTISPGKYGRLDTSDPDAVMRWAKDGYAIKSAMCHDGYYQITGRNCTLVWILAEAIDKDPRISVVYDEAGSTMHEIGRSGYRRIKGYLELSRIAQRLRETGDFRHHTVLDPQSKWAFPEYVEDATVELAGMTEVPDGPR